MNATELSIGQRLFLIAAALLAIGGTVVGVIDRARLEEMLLATGDLATAWGAGGLVLVALVQFLAALVGIVPGSLLGVAAGALYGPVTGFAVSAASLMAAAAAAFLLSRSWLKPTAERIANRYGRVADVSALLAADGWRFVCLLRLSPVLPFAPTSYLLGLSKVGFGAYMTGTLASLPALLGYVLVGHATVAGAGADSLSELVQAGSLVLGLIATVGLMVYVGKRVAQVMAVAVPD